MRTILLVLALSGCMSAERPDVAARTAAVAVPSISQVLADCGAPGEVPGLPAGTDLQRVDIDLTAFPDARCNDGSGATFFFRPSATLAGRARWVIQLQGGGGCRTPEACARRWCSVGTNFGMNQMTSTRLPAVGTPGRGVLYRGAQFTNPYDDANHVLLPYCSSDTHAGDTGELVIDAHHPVTNAPVQFSIAFQGQAVFDALITTLRRDGAAPPDYTLGGGATPLPDLDGAIEVVLAGASAGGGGVINNVDRLRDLLRTHSTACNASCPLVRALIDSTFGPSNETLDWSTSTMCATIGACTWEDVLGAATSMYQTSGDTSCESWHAAFAPATAYLCDDTDHVVRNHVTTPFMVRQGLRDSLLSENAIESGVSVPGQGPMTLSLFVRLVRDQLAALAQITATAEEGAAISTIPAAFGPPCPDHETLSANPAVYNVQVQAAGVLHTMFDIYDNWISSALPRQAIHRPGDPVICP
jgi:hypothetical protein